MNKTTLIEFPCNFSVKIIGSNTNSFFEEIYAIVQAHFPNAEHHSLTKNLSQKSNFLAITATVYVENQEMLDNFYRELTKHPDIKMVL